MDSLPRYLLSQKRKWNGRFHSTDVEQVFTQRETQHKILKVLLE